jgi:hypothetical protein
MPRVRYSLSSLMGIVALVSLAMAGATSASRRWTAVASTVTLAVLLGAILAAWQLERVDRAFWAGFALFGWTYLVLVNWDWIGGQFGHDLTGDLSTCAEWLIADVPTPVVPPFAGMAPPPAGPVVAMPPGPVPAMPGGTARPQPDPRAQLPGTAAAPAPRAAFASRVSAEDYLASVQQRQIKVGNFVQIGRMVLALFFAYVGGMIGAALAERRKAAA